MTRRPPGPHAAQRRAGTEPSGGVEATMLQAQEARGAAFPHERQRQAGKRFCAENYVFKAQKNGDPPKRASVYLSKWGGTFRSKISLHRREFNSPTMAVFINRKSPFLRLPASNKGAVNENCTPVYIKSIFSRMASILAFN